MNINEIRKEAESLQKMVHSMMEGFTAKTGCLIEISTETTVLTTTEGTPIMRNQDVHTKVIL